MDFKSVHKPHKASACRPVFVTNHVASWESFSTTERGQLRQSVSQQAGVTGSCQITALHSLWKCMKASLFLLNQRTLVLVLCTASFSVKIQSFTHRLTWAREPKQHLQPSPHESYSQPRTANTSTPAESAPLSTKLPYYAVISSSPHRAAKSNLPLQNDAKTATRSWDLKAEVIHNGASVKLLFAAHAAASETGGW